MFQETHDRELVSKPAISLKKCCGGGGLPSNDAKNQGDFVQEMLGWGYRRTTPKIKATVGEYPQCHHRVSTIITIVESLCTSRTDTA